MNHPPSEYKATITITFTQMVEVHKAITARISYLLSQVGHNAYSETDIDTLLEITEVLDAHEQEAMSDWERKVAEREAHELDDDDAVRRFLDQ